MNANIFLLASFKFSSHFKQNNADCRTSRTRPSRQKQQNGKHFQPARKEWAEKAELAVEAVLVKSAGMNKSFHKSKKRILEQKLKKKYAKIIQENLFVKL